MDYGYLVKNLLNEAKRGIQYQSMNKICKIFPAKYLKKSFDCGTM